MKLLYLHIDNFGKLSDFDCYLQDGLNTICTDNGAGKTTLGTFIKVMFYGFANETRRKDDKERLHYKPWQGGTYGGFVIFEENGKTYELSRTFGDKPSEDTSSLKDAITLLESKDFDPSVIGKQLFQIDAGSYARTAFISQNEYDYGSLSDIDAKIGHLIEEDDDMNHYASAEQALNDAVSALTTRRGSGELDHTREQMAEIRREIQQKPSVFQAMEETEQLLNQKRGELSHLEGENAEIDQRISDESEAKDQAVLKTEYDALRANVRQFAKACAQESMHYPYGIPNAEEISERINEANTLNVYEAAAASSRMSEEELAEYARLHARYENRTYVPEAFAQMEDKIRVLNDTREHFKEIDLTQEEKDLLEAEEKVVRKFSETEAQMILNLWNTDREELKRRIMELRLTGEEETNLRGLKRTFEEEKPDLQLLETLYNKWTYDREIMKNALNGFHMSDAEEEELETLHHFFDEHPLNTKRVKRLAGAWAARSDIQGRVSGAEVEIQALKGQISETRHRRRTILLAGLSLAVIGVILGLFLPIHIIGVLIVVAGAGLIAFTLGPSYDTTLASMNRKIKTLRHTIEEAKKELDDMERYTTQLLAEYDVVLDSSKAIVQLNNLKAHYDRYRVLNKTAASNRAKEEEVQRQIEQFDAYCAKVVNSYGYSFSEARFTHIVEDIFMDQKRYGDLLTKKQANDDRIARIKKRIDEIEQRAFEFLRGFGYQPVEELVQENIWELQARYRKYIELKNRRDVGELKKLRDTRTRLNGEVEEFLRWYTGSSENEENYYYVLKQVESDLQAYKALSDRKAASDLAAAQYQELRTRLESYLSSYGVTPENGLLGQLEEMRSHALVYQTQMEHYESAFQALKQFELNHENLDAEELEKENNSASLTELNQERQNRTDSIRSIREEIYDLQNRSNELNETYNMLCDREGELERLQGEAAEMEKKLFRLEKARDYLQKARESLNARYAAPLRASLKEYFGILGRYSGFEIDVNANKEVLLKADGAERSVQSLSEGYQDIVDVCLRIALIDAMYTDVKPLIILDDPFINLDSRGIEAGLQLLEDISDRYQILYMTCHDSRVLGEEMQIPFAEC